MNRRKFFKHTAIGSIIGLLFNPFKLKSKELQCCERDIDFDGNCDKHPDYFNFVESNKYLNNFDHYLNVDELSNIGRPGHYKIHLMIGYEIKDKYYECVKLGRISTTLENKKRIIEMARMTLNLMFYEDNGYVEVDVFHDEYDLALTDRDRYKMLNKVKIKHDGMFLFEKGYKLPEDKKHLKHIYLNTWRRDG